MSTGEQPGASAAEGRQRQTRRFGHQRQRRSFGLRAAVLLALVGLGVLSIPSAAGAVPVPFKNCGAPSDLISVSKLDASIWPPVAGQPITLSLVENVGQVVSGGSQRAELSLLQFGFQLPLQFSQPALSAGPLDRLVTFDVPPGVGGQVLGLHFSATSSTGAEIVCIDVTVPFKGAASPFGPFVALFSGLGSLQFLHSWF
jgi:hypothetical protein